MYMCITYIHVYLYVYVYVYTEATKQVRRDMHVCDTTDSYVTILLRICIHVT